MIRSPAAPSLGLPPYNWWEEATHGVGTSHENTNVAFPITTGMSFNRTATSSIFGPFLDHLSRIYALVSSTPPPHAPCATLYPVTMLVGC